MWQKTYKQKESNTIRTKCFRVKMLNESNGITMESVMPTRDEEAMEYDGYTFTIKNICETPAYYQVNLEELIEEKKLPNKYIRVSLNNNKGKNLNTFKEVETTIENADMSHKLTSGALRANEEITYTLKMWMDEETPAIKEVMNTTFTSKVTITATYKEEIDLENEIETSVGSKNEEISKEKEEITITVNGEGYDIVEYSPDGENFYLVENPGKDITIDVTLTEEGKHIVYVKDEVGNIKEVEVETTKLDQTAPTIEIETNDKQETIELTINFKDEKSGLLGYKITESNIEPTEWDSFEEFARNSTNTKTIKFTISKNTTYYIWIKDKVGNINYKAYSTTTIDTKAPELEVRNKLSSYGLSDTITIIATDDIIGLSGVSITRTEGEYHWKAIDETPLEYSKTVEVEENGTYYISIKDAYDHITTKQIVIDKIDRESPTSSFSTPNSTQGTNEWYQDLNIKVDLSDNLSGIKTAKYCVTTNDTCTPDVTATISSNSYTVTLTSNVSAQKVCSQVTDNANNTSDIKCSNTYKVDTTDPSQNFSIASSTSGTNNWYTALSVKVTVSDLDSKVASAKYCVTTNDTCTPDTMATLSNNEFSVTLGTNASAQKVCVQTTDNAGRTNSVTCSQAYKVDTVNPIAQVNANRGDSSITLSAASSSDSGSGISTYYYSKDNGSTWQTSATSTYTFTGLSFKEYTFAIKVIDKAGRTSSVVTTKATPLVQLYRTITASAPLDNTSSTYVSSSTGIDFGAAPSDTNGKGIYKLSSTINDTNPIYYYRGEVTNNNVKFARLCWKIVRTTDTAGIKLIYNGAPDSNGGCTNTTGTSTQIRFGAFNTKYDSADYVGYMYPETTNANNSTIKTYIDDWYSKNMTNYTKYLEDTVWCNNRRIARDDSDETDVVIYYEGNENLYLNNKPKLSLVCPNNNDKFTVSSTKGNGKLTYPVAVLTADEATFAGHGYKGSRKSYLCTNQSWWTMTPSNYVYIDKITTHNTDVFAVSYGGSALPNDVKNPHEDYPEVSIGIRPSVSLNSGILINSGNGTANNPYQIHENK